MSLGWSPSNRGFLSQIISPLKKPNVDTEYEVKKYAFKTATVNKLANITRIHLGFNTSLSLLLYNYTLHCIANTLPHSLCCHIRVRARAGGHVGDRSQCLLCHSGYRNVPSMVGMNNISTAGYAVC